MVVQPYSAVVVRLMQICTAVTQPFVQTVTHSVEACKDAENNVCLHVCLNLVTVVLNLVTVVLNLVTVVLNLVTVVLNLVTVVLNLVTVVYF